MWRSSKKLRGSYRFPYAVGSDAVCFDLFCSPSRSRLYINAFGDVSCCACSHTKLTTSNCLPVVNRVCLCGPILTWVESLDLVGHVTR